MGYNQWVAGRSLGPGLPRPWQDFLSGAFGPLSPLVPMPIDEPVDSGRATPRRWQYPVGWNLPVGQPGTEGLKLASFPILRQYADIYSVVRAMLNIRKEELAGLNWDIGPTADAQQATKGDKAAVSDQKDRAKQIVNWFKRVDPDYYGFQSWFSALLEDQFVIDAVAIHLHPTRVDGKGLFGSSLAHLVTVNGETIRPLVDIKGGTPRPPSPAYQQYLWGVPRSDLMSVMTGEDLVQMQQDLEAVDLSDVQPEEEYAADQMLYLPHVRRTWTPYGFSPIEQALMPITIGLKRQEFLLDFFTEGTIPGVYVIAGDQYVTPAQQRQLQDSLNALAGDQAWKHRVIVLPPGSKTDAQKDLSWQAQVDQTITEQVAMILHIQPHEIGQVPGGRTSGLGGKGMVEGQQSAIIEQRTNPYRKWWKESLFDWVIQKVFGQKDLEWKWVDFDEAEDEEKKSAARKADISIGRITIDETRVEDGLDPFNTPYTQSPIVIMAGQVVPLDPNLKPIPAAPAGGPGAAAPDGTPLPPGHQMHPDGKHMLPPAHNLQPDGSVQTPDGKTVPPEKLPVAPTGGAQAVGPDGKPLPPGAAAHAGPPPGTPGSAVPTVEHGATPPGTPGATPAATAQPGVPVAHTRTDQKRPGGKKALPFKKKVAGITVADLVKGHIKYKGDLTPVVYRYLLRSYPKDVVTWVKDGDWEYDPKVKLSDINMARRPGGRNPAKVTAISDTLTAGASMDPVVLVKRQDDSQYKYDIADGWHRTLGAEQAGLDEVPAFIGHGFDDKADWGLEMQDESASKKKAALAELAVLRRYLRKGGDITKFRTSALDSDIIRLIANEGRTPEVLERARVWIDKAGGNPEALREWYNEGADGQIDWGSPGDFDQCVEVASAYMDDEQAKGFCNLRHQDAVGGPPGTEDKADNPYAIIKYSEDEPRDEAGRWAAGGGVADRTAEPPPYRRGDAVRILNGHRAGRIAQVLDRADHRGNRKDDGEYLRVAVTSEHGERRAGAGLYHHSDVTPADERTSRMLESRLAFARRGEEADIEKDFSLSAPLTTGFVPYDLAGASPSPGSVCAKCGKQLGPDGQCPDHPTGKLDLLAAIDAELARRGIDIDKLTED